MKIIWSRLHNFKIHRDFEFKPNGASAVCRADNAVGKSSLADSAYWLLFDKNSLNKTFNPITRVDGERLHHEKTSVETMFELDGGERVTLKKEFSEEYGTVRGVREKLLGHKTSYWINGVPTGTETVFKERVRSICDEKLFQLLSDPLYFNTQLK